MTEQSTRPSGSIARRTLVAGSAWAVPAVALATPAHALAASQCVVQTTFDNLTVGTCVGTIPFTPSLVTATVTYAYGGGFTASRRGDTCKVERTTTTPPFSYVEVEMVGTGGNNSITQGHFIDVTITLSQAMENLSFTIHDIDSRQSGYRDDIILVTPGGTATKGSTIIGSGTSGDPFRRNGWGDEPINSGNGSITATWAGPITAVTFRYRAGISGNSQNQHVALSRISFSDCLEAQAARRATPVANDVPLVSNAKTSDGVIRDL